MFVPLVLVSVIVTVSLPPATVRETPLVTPPLLARLFSPDRLANVLTLVEYQ